MKTIGVDSMKNALHSSAKPEVRAFQTSAKAATCGRKTGKGKEFNITANDISVGLSVGLGGVKLC